MSAVIGVVCSIVMLLFALFNHNSGFAYHDRRGLRLMRTFSWVISGLALLYLITGPIVALTVTKADTPVYAMLMVGGLAQMVILAVQIADLHLIKAELASR